MRKAQLSLEYIFVTAVVIGVAFLAFMYYKEEGMHTLVEATLENKINWELAKASLDHPNCSESYLYEIGKDAPNFYDVSYEIHSSRDKYDFERNCTTKIITGDILNQLKGLANVVLGCRYDYTGVC